LLKSVVFEGEDFGFGKMVISRSGSFLAFFGEILKGKSAEMGIRGGVVLDMSMANTCGYFFVFMWIDKGIRTRIHYISSLSSPCLLIFALIHTYTTQYTNTIYISTLQST
jgi:hypothetical protein